MRKLVLVAGALSALLFAQARATEITGEINFAGSDSFNAVTKVLTAFNPADVLSTTGAYNAFGACLGCVTFKPTVNYGSFTPTPNVVSGIHNGVAMSIDLLSETLLLAKPTGVDFQGTALLHLTGFDATPGTVFFSTQGPQDTRVSFSSTATAVPAPAALSVFLVGLLGLGLAKYRPRRTQAA